MGRKVVGAGGRAVAEELPGAGAEALPGRACRPQRWAAQVSGRDAGQWAVGGRACGVSPFPGIPVPLPLSFQTGVQHSPESRHLSVAPMPAQSF